MKETKRKFYKKICKWKKQILCVGAGIFLGIAAWLAQGMDPVIEAGNVIQRPDIDDGQVDQELYVKGLVDQEKEMVLKLPVSARQYTKEEIFELYVNTIDFGSGYYGIYDAAMGYFGKTPQELTDWECAMLAGLPNASLFPSASVCSLCLSQINK